MFSSTAHFFYTKLSIHGYSGVSGWHKDVDTNIKQLLIFPVHQPVRAHWCLVVVDIQKKEIVCYDSLYKENSACLEEFKNYIFKINGENFATKQDTNIPMQTNSYDCGAFVCAYAHCLAASSIFNFTQLDISVIRQRMVSELLYFELFMYYLFIVHYYVTCGYTNITYKKKKHVCTYVALAPIM